MRLWPSDGGLHDRQAEFLDQLNAMLEVIEPRYLDVAGAGAALEDGLLAVMLPHAARSGWSIYTEVCDEEARVECLTVHEHFAATVCPPSDGRPWTTVAVDFVAEILRGRIEVETMFRGTAVLASRHFSVERGERQQAIGYIGYLHPARLAFWQPRRTEVERPRFDSA